MIQFSALAFLFLLPALTAAQLSGSVGPLTSYSAKAAVKTCDVTDYGAVADLSTDLGTALASAFAACKSGGLVVIPEGDYAMSTWVTLNGGSAWALQLDGTIYRTGTAGGNMILSVASFLFFPLGFSCSSSIEHTSDFELFSSTSSGAVQGYGYKYHVDGSLSGPRILRLYDVSDFSVHDIALVDAPAFHFSLDTCSNGEVYNMAIRGGNSGGLDGIDVMVTNKDECVTVKSPAKNILVENIYCNWSGGSAFGDGACLKDGSASSYAMVTQTVKTAPSSYSAKTLPDDLTTDFGTTASIPIPTIPTSFYPGATPVSALLGNSGSSKRSTGAAQLADVASATASASTTRTNTAASSLITSNSSSSSLTTSSLSVSNPEISGSPVGEGFGQPEQQQGGQSSGGDNHKRRFSKKRRAGLHSVSL
ncbi:related to Probable rhamnogalacturonase B [Armillaria ostoyae]|uniref:Related to Probable rhamnogalacturonase B n=1 Tax=Armillaria ostoyae TaxID=47428 RepID=A0A284QZU6_ARMOS|nr:related to Probable rhamnogalacturonase B [Armillaria ostoyae]